MESWGEGDLGFAVPGYGVGSVAGFYGNGEHVNSCSPRIMP